MENIMIASDCPLLVTGISALLEQVYEKPTITAMATYDSMAELWHAGIYGMVVIAMEHCAVNWASLRNLAPACPVLLISQNTDPGYAKILYRAGIKGFLPMSADIGEVLLAIRELSQGHIYMTENLKRYMVGREALELAPGQGLKLTGREKEVMQLMLSGRSNTQIGKALMLKPSTVSTFKSNIFKKTGTGTILQLDRYIALSANSALGINNKSKPAAKNARIKHQKKI